MGSTPRPNLEEGNILSSTNPDKKYKHPISGQEITIPGNKGTLEGGEELYKDILNELRTGMPKELRDLIESQSKGAISGNLKSGEESLNRQFAREGDVPIGAKVDAVSGLREGANKSLKDLYLGLGEMDYNAKNRAFGKYGDLIRLALEKARTGNDAKLQGYAIDRENDFSLGEGFGGLFGMGGNILGGLASGGYL